ncbi:MAG: glutaminyl-peptide cyclotransferase [Rhodopila sp.]|nr:glutaminyl-peptide cyclotransferase [Rhodopila sp.]
MKMRTFRTAALVIIAVAATALARVHAAVPEYNAVIVKTYPHDPRAFTEGLLYYGGFLYESTGRNGQSSIRKVMLETGSVVQQRDIDPKYFGEGIVNWKDRLIELTWKSEIGFVYDLATFKPLSDFHYTGEGWALTQDGSHLIMSDGTSDLRILEPDSLREIRRIHVTCDGHSIQNINELEWVKGEIYANIWWTSLIVRINPATGEVVGVIDLTDVAALAAKGGVVNVLNGIAYDAAGDRLFVTGKLWPTLYQITLSRRPGGNDPCGELPQAPDAIRSTR